MPFNAVIPPFEKPDPPLEVEFANYMAMAVAQSVLNAFEPNLWGLGITTDLETEIVEAHFFFSSEPTDLDRYEISESVFSFGAATGGGVVMRVHRTVMDRGAYHPRFGELRWIHLERHPGAELPDDVGFDELDY